MKRKSRKYKSINEASDVSVDEWIRLGQPEMWATIEVWGEYEVKVDIGYGQIALYCGGKRKAVGKNFCTDGKVIALDAKYYGVPKYIWT